jgi:hypothetical protein
MVPRSTANELVALSEELGARHALVRRIGLKVTGWDNAPRRIRPPAGHHPTLVRTSKDA